VLLGEPERTQEVTNLDDLFLGEVARTSWTKRDRLALHGDRLISAVRLVYLAETSEERTHVVPLNVATKRMRKEFLGSEAVVVIQLD
jgi:hypothetical protein